MLRTEVSHLFCGLDCGALRSKVEIWCATDSRNAGGVLQLTLLVLLMVPVLSQFVFYVYLSERIILMVNLRKRAAGPLIFLY